MRRTRVGRVIGVAVGSLVLCGIALRAFAVIGASALDAVREPGPDAPADLIVLGSAALGLVLVLWLGLGLLLAVLAALPGAVGRIADVAADVVAPPLVRRVTAALLGTTLAATGTPLAQAAEPAPAPTTTAVRVSVGPAPDPAFRVTGRTPVADAPMAQQDPPVPQPTAPDPAFGRTELGPLGPAPHTPRLSPATVTVARGDSLWAIAARHLGPGASRRQIAQEWPRWYAANRAVIGSDPDLIRVGQVLTVPGSAS